MTKTTISSIIEEFDKESSTWDIASSVRPLINGYYKQKISQLLDSIPCDKRELQNTERWDIPLEAGEEWNECIDEIQQWKEEVKK